jgi:hypothetical protein
MKLSDLKIDFPNAKDAREDVDSKMEIERFQTEDILKSLRDAIYCSHHHTACTNFVFHQNDNQKLIMSFVKEYLDEKGYQTQMTMVSEFQLFISVIF